MKKADPNAVIDTFQKRVNDSLTDWRAIDAAILSHTSGPDALRLRRRAASDSFLSLVISWESFLSSWIVAAVNRDPSQAAQRLTEKLTAFSTDELNVPSTVLARSLLATSHLNLDVVSGILDKKGQNNAVRDHAELKKLARNWLAGPFRIAAEGISSYQFSPAVIGRLVRNALAHESDSALKEVNTRSRSHNVKPEFRVTRVRDLSVRSWRAYLFQNSTMSTPAVPRVELFHLEYHKLAHALRVP